MNFLWMMLAFLVMTGAALLFCSACKVNMGEGILLSASGMILLLYVSGRMGTFAYGMYAMYALAAAGWLWALAAAVRKRGNALAQLASPYFLALLSLFLLALVIYCKAFIQNIDELHQWALIVKYMLREDSLPGACAVVDHAHPYGTGLFHLFFQRITGYNEGNMYSSALLLMWIGFLLPFSSFPKKEWKKVALYAAVVYIALYSLYSYSTKTVNVDMPTAAWAGGLAGWWVNREKKKSNALVAGAGLLALCSFKMATGPLLAVMVLLFMLAQTLIIEKGLLEQPKHRKIFTCAMAALFAAGVLLTAVMLYILLIGKARQALPAGLQDRLQRLEFSFEKIRLTAENFLTYAVGRTLHSASQLKVAFTPFIGLLLVLIKLTGDVFQQKKEQWLYSLYMVVSCAGYCLMMYVAYLLMFPFFDSTTVLSIWRYLSICAVYTLVWTLSWLLKQSSEKRPQAGSYLMLGLLLLFGYGINKAYIPSTTSFDAEELSYYETFESLKSQMARLQLAEDDKVYFLDQLATNELPMGAALYYLEDQVNNYLATPWKFSEEGSTRGLATLQEDVGIENFPDLLAQGGYTYLWIYHSDRYLWENLPKVMECEAASGGSLYRIGYEDGKAVSLELVRDLEEDPEENLEGNPEGNSEEK